MNEIEIKNKAFEFVEKLKIIGEFPPPNGKKQELKGSLSHLQFVDLSNKMIDSSPIIQTQKIDEINDERIHISIEKKTYGFKNSDYSLYYKFIYELSLLNDLKSKVSIKYLRIQTLLWIIDVYRNNKAEQDLINHLLDKLEKEVKKVKYYYPILNLSIEKSFSIGNIKIMYFTKEYFDSRPLKTY